MNKAWLVRFSLAVSAVAMAVLGFAGNAAAQITVGQVAPPTTILLTCESTGFDEAQKTVSEGASYVVPTAGVLTSWSTRSNIGGVLGLKVYRPIAGAFLVLAADGPRTLGLGGVTTFPVSIPVQPGDLVGTHWPAGANSHCIFNTGLAGDVLRFSSGNAAVGAPVALAGTEGNLRTNISATLLPPPTITSISPASGSIAGRSVTIAGTNFANVSAVSFGGVPAAGYAVNSSEGQITATAPASKLPGSVSVTVTTVAGTASSIQAYSYLACTVPKLKGKSLKASKKAIKKAGCKVGKVTKRGGATGKTGKVSKQNPKPGKVVITGTQVKVTLKPQS